MPDKKTGFLSSKILFILIILLILLFLVIDVVLAPAQYYFDFYRQLNLKAVQVNDIGIGWNQLKQELNIVKFDKSLKTREQKVKAAIDKAVERQLLIQAVGKNVNNLFALDAYSQFQQLAQQLVKESVNRRTGGYFIAKFTNPNATESASLLKQQAKQEIVKLKERLDQGIAFNQILAEANQNQIIKKLNYSAFLPGVYLTSITEDQFPLKIKSFRQSFFQAETGTTSAVLTLSWDDYDGVSYGEKFSGDFAYAVFRIDHINPGYFKSYQDWVSQAKQKANIKSYVYIPFYFKWF